MNRGRVLIAVGHDRRPDRRVDRGRVLTQHIFCIGSNQGVTHLVRVRILASTTRECISFQT